MGLIDDDGVIHPQKRVSLGLCQQYSVGHELDRGTWAGVIRKANLIPDILADGGT